MVLRNKGATPLKLVKASNPASKVTELHAHLNEGGVMKMRQVPFIEVPAKGEAILKPGSLHVMLIDVIQPLKEGEQIVLTLGLEDGTSLAVPAPVRRPDLGVVPDAGTAAAAAHHPH